MITVNFEAMTGERWSEQASLFDEVSALKRRVWKRRGILPSRQALVFCDRALPDSVLLSTAGLRDGSLVKCIIMPRTGPSSSQVHEEVQALSDDPSDREFIGRVMSAAEDTSAKESAGETERECGEVPRKPLRYGECANRRRTRSQTNFKAVDASEDGVPVEVGPSASTKTVKERGEVSNTDEATSEGFSEVSEVSSGVLVCDLSNEFRKLKIKKHRHLLPPWIGRQRNRSKTRGEHDVSSSEESEAVIVSSLPVTSASTRKTVRTTAGSRCNKCAFRVTNPFFCRCGKTLCAKHRTHTCARQRNKIQEVSD